MRSRGIERATSFLQDLLRREDAPVPGARLPSLPGLAGACGVATRTMARAVRRLAAAGTLTVVPGGGVFRGDGPAACVPGAAPEPDGTGIARWREVRDMVAADITAGTLASQDRLPALKDLAVRYGTCSRTLRTALSALRNDRLLELRNRQWNIRRTARPQASAAIVALVEQEVIIGTMVQTPRSRELWNHVERECVRLGLRFEICSANAFLNARRQKRMGTVLGYLVVVQHLSTDVLLHLLASLSATGCPAAVIDERPGGRVADLPRRYATPLLRFFALGTDELPGEVVGDYLRDAGHRRVASFQQGSAAAWSVARSRGLVRAFVKAGLPSSAVTTYTPAGIVDDDDIFLAIDSWPPVVALHSDPVVEREAVSTSWAKILRTDQLYTGYGSLHIWGECLQELFDPPFRAALMDRSITAWVAASDVIGLLALDFLRRRKVAVPADVSVVGFDNTGESFVAGLSSYNFNVPGVVQAMMQHLLPPDTRGRRRCLAEYVRIPGMVMQRRSSGPAPAASPPQRKALAPSRTVKPRPGAP